MDNESTNWCRLAETIMQKGGEVLRRFLLLEILTTIFTNYTRFWMNKVHNPAENDYLAILRNNLNEILKRSQHPSDKRLNDLLKSWSLVRSHQMPVMEQRDILQRWKNDIENEPKKYVSSSGSITVKSWLSEIDQEMQKMNSICSVLRQWNNTFHSRLQNAQSGFHLEIEKNDGFLSDCIYKLKSLSITSSREFQQHVQTFQTKLKAWKEKCHEVLQGFREECLKMITVWQREDQGVPLSYAMVKFLNRFKTEVDDWNLQSHLNIFCGKWYDDLHNVFSRYEKLIPKGDSTEVILNLAKSMCTELEQLPSFKEKKIRDFFSVFNPPEFPRLLNIQTSKLKDIGRSSDLNEFDLTILIAVWKNGDFVHSPLQDWNDDPYEWDTSISADILRLKEHRNIIVAHTPELRISSETFEKLWKQLTMLLRKISSRCGDVFEVDISRKDYPREPHRLYKLRKECLTWCKTDILAQLSAGSAAGCQCLDMLGSIQTALENLHRNRKACTCRTCGTQFFTESEFAQHRRIHHGLIHADRLSEHGRLEQHNMIHKVYRCCICNAGPHDICELRKHMWQHHDSSCGICYMTCSSEGELDRHMFSHHAITCLSCRKDFSSQTELEQHMMCHQARTCRSCNNGFSRGCELDNHMIVHQARTCRSCNKGFSGGYELQAHENEHQARTCPSCKHEFSTDRELTEHVRNCTDCPSGIIGFLNSLFRN